MWRKSQQERLNFSLLILMTLGPRTLVAFYQLCLDKMLSEKLLLTRIHINRKRMLYLVHNTPFLGNRHYTHWQLSVPR